MTELPVLHNAFLDKPAWGRSSLEGMSTPNKVSSVALAVQLRNLASLGSIKDPEHLGRFWASVIVENGSCRHVRTWCEALLNDASWAKCRNAGLFNRHHVETF